jgi:hypothetical protein
MSTLQPEQSIQQALHRFKKAYEELFELIDTYPVTRREVAGACGVWSPKQLIDHLSGWIVEANQRYDHFDAGHKEPKQYDFDIFNAASVEERAHQNWSESLAEVHNRAKQFEERAADVSPDSPMIKRYAAWLDALAEDCEEHTEQLRAFLHQASGAENREHQDVG